MENQDVIDKDDDNVVSEEMNADESGKNVFYKYRGTGKCISDGISFLTDHFFRFIRLTLPVSIPLAVLFAAYIYISCDMSMMQSVGMRYVLSGLLLAAFLVVSVQQGIIFRLLKLYTDKVDMKSITYGSLYKTVWGSVGKTLGCNLVSEIIGSIVIGLAVLIWLMPVDGFEMGIVKMILLGIWLLAGAVMYIPYEISMPALIFGKKKFFPALWYGYVLGLKKIGKVMALFVVLFFLVGILLTLTLSPAIVIAMMHHSASFSMVVGDAVSLPDNFAVYSILILFLASFFSTLLTWMQCVPMSYLYASLEYDVEEQKRNELPMV
ncbi:MAG: hypothetical protein LUD00_03955 [Prevotellaceae bacterium]|nr:hypothetical protein [Prevotellaceae bacterium]